MTNLFTFHFISVSYFRLNLVLSFFPFFFLLIKKFITNLEKLALKEKKNIYPIILKRNYHYSILNYTIVYFIFYFFYYITL